MSDNKPCPFTRAPASPRRPKIFMWGDTGTKKTRTSLAFPHAVCLDTEGGTELYGAEFAFERIVTADFDEADQALLWLLTHKHSYSTVIVDPITVIWDAVQRKWRDIFMARRKRANPAWTSDQLEDFNFEPLDWQRIKGDFKAFIRKLIMLDMTVIVTARQKALLAGEGKDFMRKIGDTFDGEKSLPYLFDIIVRTMKDPNSGEMVGECIKDRSGHMPKTLFPLSYEVFERAFGRKELERGAGVTEMITEAQKATLAKLFTDRRLDDAAVSRGLERYDAERIEELTATNAATIIEKLSHSIIAPNLQAPPTMSTISPIEIVLPAAGQASAESKTSSPDAKESATSQPAQEPKRRGRPPKADTIHAQLDKFIAEHVPDARVKLALGKYGASKTEDLSAEDAEKILKVFKMSYQVQESANATS